MLKSKSSSSIPGDIDQAARAAFNLAYHRSKDARLQRAREIADGDGVRLKAMQALAVEMPVDPEIDVNNDDAYLCMIRREARGLKAHPAYTMPGSTAFPDIPTSTNIADYQPINPPRSFNIWDFHDVVTLLSVDLGVMVGNDDGYMVLPGGMPAAIAHKSDLRGIFPMPPSFAPWALPHFGVCIDGVRPDGELVVDAEEIANQADLQAVIAFIQQQAKR